MHKLFEESLTLIPGGSQLFSKRPQLHLPNGWPTYFASAHGIEVTDLDGRTYRDFCGAGVGAAVLGWADPDVDAAAVQAIQAGQTGPLLGPEEVELARILTHLHPWAGMCRFTRAGGEAMAVAIRIAQARTGRLNVYHTSSYHGWHVNSPIDNARFIPWNSDNNFAAIIIEPERLTPADVEALAVWRKRADTNHAVLIFDEISCGFRSNLGGAHLKYGIEPDIAVFGKAISNGYPMGAVVGRTEVMQAAESTFISSTAWSERIGPSTAIATIQKMWAKDVFEHTKMIGNLVKKSVEDTFGKAGMYVHISGMPHQLHFTFENLREQTLYTQLMLDHGFLAGKDFYPTYAHTVDSCNDFAATLGKVAPQLKDYGKLKSDVVSTGVRRL